MAQYVTVLYPPIGLLLVFALGCQSTLPPPEPRTSAKGTMVSSIAVPIDVQRLAIVYPQTSNAELRDAYVRLEGATFQLKDQRPSLKIVDRFNLPALLTEHRLQFGGAVSEETAIRLGRLLGVDSVLIYRIEGPTWRDRLLARQHSDLPPVIVMSKIIRVESAEVVFHNVVTARVEDQPEWEWSSSESTDFQRSSRAALERGIAQTVDDLRRAFE